MTAHMAMTERRMRTTLCLVVCIVVVVVGIVVFYLFVVTVRVPSLECFGCSLDLSMIVKCVVFPCNTGVLDASGAHPMQCLECLGCQCRKPWFVFGLCAQLGIFKKVRHSVYIRVLSVGQKTHTTHKHMQRQQKHGAPNTEAARAYVFCCRCCWCLIIMPMRMLLRLWLLTCFGVVCWKGGVSAGPNSTSGPAAVIAAPDTEGVSAWWRIFVVYVSVSAHGWHICVLMAMFVYMLCLACFRCFGRST